MSEKRYDDILLICDLDGTLIPRYEMIAEDNVRALNAFTAAGGAFAVATGRTPESALPYLDGITINTPSIFFNGAMLKDLSADQVLEARTLEGDLWRTFAARILYQFPRACVEVYTQEQCNIISPKENDDPRLEEEFYSVNHTTLRDMEDATWLKFFICDAPINLSFIERLAKELGIDQCSTSFYSDANYLEFVPPGTSKGAMAEVLHDMPAYTGRRVIACGDYENDIELLRMADIGIAPEDASKDAKEAADRIAPPCREPIVPWLLRDVL